MALLKDIKGQRFGRLLVVMRDSNHPTNNSVRWLCQCDCGNTKSVGSSKLNSGGTKSCGCLKHEEGRKALDLTNQRFSKLVAIRLGEKYVSPSGHTATRWECLCDCGNTTQVTVQNLRSGSTRSCGCLRSEVKRDRGNACHNWKGYEEISSTLWWRINRNAETRNIDFNVTIEQAWVLFLKQDRRCAISGIELQFATTRQEKEQTASLDRIDSSRGYTIDNVQWVHKDINIMKKDHSLEYFLEMCRSVTNYN